MDFLLQRLLTDFKFLSPPLNVEHEVTNANGFFGRNFSLELNMFALRADDWHRQAHVAIFQMLLDDVVSAAAQFVIGVLEESVNSFDSACCKNHCEPSGSSGLN